MQIVVSTEVEKTECHPIIRTHPVTGRQGLFINDVYTIAIAGMDQAESNILLKRLFKHMTRDELVYCHRWQADMLVLWDNRCVVHYAGGGYEGYQRIMYRTTLAGERPT
jgi:taurine dioxygenase